MGNGLIQKFPHIHLCILIRTEANIVHQIVHIHLDTAVLHLLEITPDVSGIRESAGQHRIKIAVRRGTIIIMINTVLIILTNAGEICRVQSVTACNRCGGIVCIGGCSVHHRQVFFPNGRRVAELDLFSRLQNEVRIGSIFVTQPQFVYRKGNLICGVFVRLQICKCLLCCIFRIEPVSIGHLSAVVIPILCSFVCQIQFYIAQIFLAAVRIQQTQMEIGYAVADLIRIVQSLGKIFRYLIIDHRIDEPALLACLCLTAVQCCQIIFQRHLLPDRVFRTIACFLCFLFLIHCRSIALGRKCLGVERCNGVFPINLRIQNLGVCQVCRVLCRCFGRCHTAAAFSHRHCIFVFTVNVLIGVGGCEILGIGICFHACAVCDILVSADTGQSHILQSRFCLGSTTVRSGRIKALEIVVHPANAHNIRQIGGCHFRSCDLIGGAGSIVVVRLPCHLYTVFVRLECNVFVFCKPRICTRLCNGIEHFHSAELVCFLRNCVGLRQFKAAVEHIAAVLGTLFQERNVYGIGIAMVPGFIVQVADCQHGTLSVVVLLDVVYLIGKRYRCSRLIGQFVLHVCIILCLLVCICLGIPVVIRHACTVGRRLVPVVSSVCIRQMC